MTIAMEKNKAGKWKGVGEDVANLTEEWGKTVNAKVGWECDSMDYEWMALLTFLNSSALKISASSKLPIFKHQHFKSL